ncbi:cytochrome c oxidase assembly protein COX16 homolog, mitochondrial [Hylaeus anthracinus]|uniref:cytochrome c oxidase assembly protein COX16 homolog, mitochondrial n=1 Tax=Hylaeus anthracinus TaxID=313031 RepID=UPI0023B8F361|nr:cytochrome c oxidase assembly protein COX16 homolog, mitochondrial [Hylaeus anthracinus]
MSAFFKSRGFQQFLPFMILVIGGSYLLREFAQIRYKYKKVISYDMKKEVEKEGIKVKSSLTLEEEYENLKNKIDIDNWENVQIPKPWDEIEGSRN